MTYKKISGKGGDCCKRVYDTIVSKRCAQHYRV